MVIHLRILLPKHFSTLPATLREPRHG